MDVEMNPGRVLLVIFGAVALSSCQTSQMEIKLQQTHRNALDKHRYVSDQEQYGISEYWTPSLVGDCEDYALWMHSKIGGTLLYVRTQQGQAHIVLEHHGFIVDNTEPFVYPRERMRHKFVYALTQQHINSYLKYSKVTLAAAMVSKGVTLATPHR